MHASMTCIALLCLYNRNSIKNLCVHSRIMWGGGIGGGDVVCIVCN